MALSASLSSLSLCEHSRSRMCFNCMIKMKDRGIIIINYVSLVCNEPSCSAFFHSLFVSVTVEINTA